MLPIIALLSAISSCDPAPKVDEAVPPVIIAQTCDSCAYSLMPAPYISFGGAIPVGQPMIDSAVIIQIGTGRADEDSLVQQSIMKGLLMNKPMVHFLDPIPEVSYYIFKITENHQHIVKIASLDRNGWLMYMPGKSPVYCVPETIVMGCNDSTLVSCYFDK